MGGSKKKEKRRPAANQIQEFGELAVAVFLGLYV
jgi:hypothetical protein